MQELYNGWTNVWGKIEQHIKYLSFQACKSCTSTTDVESQSFIEMSLNENIQVLLIALLEFSKQEQHHTNLSLIHLAIDLHNQSKK